MLTTTNHDRDSAGMTYVYPVVSRRAGGVSIGINLNPNHACNWRCIYCQVPNLQRGSAPLLDLSQLAHELRSLLTAICYGDYLQQHVAPELRTLRDVALSGNGEPTTSPQFCAVMATLENVLAEFSLLGQLPVVLITNGSLLFRPEVQRGIAHLSTLGGEVWFKLDRATHDGVAQVNDTQQTPANIEHALFSCSQHCRTWVQTSVFALDGLPPNATEVQAYLDLLQRVLARGAKLAGVLIYGLARPSLQPEAPRLSAVSPIWLHHFVQQLEALSLSVRVHG